MRIHVLTRVQVYGNKITTNFHAVITQAYIRTISTSSSTQTCRLHTELHQQKYDDPTKLYTIYIKFDPCGVQSEHLRPQESLFYIK